MKKLNDIKSFFQDTEYLINNLKRELDLTRNLLYRTWVKNQKGCKIADDKVVVPDDIEFIMDYMGTNLSDEEHQMVAEMTEFIKNKKILLESINRIKNLNKLI